jgi:pimeloyl-ACP methyl ester carboxylesterase
MSNETTQLRRSPAKGDPRGTVVVLGGRGESASVYERFADRIAFDGYTVVALSDIAANPDASIAAVQEIFAESQGGPTVAVASDSAVAFLLAGIDDGATTPEGIVLAGALTDGSTAPADWTTEQELDARSSCPVHRSRLVLDGVLREGALAETSEAYVAGSELASRIDVPALAFHGSEDAISGIAAALDFYALLPDSRTFVVDGGSHDVLNDLSHRSVAAAVVQFLERLRTPERGLTPADTSDIRFSNQRSLASA